METKLEKLRQDIDDKKTGSEDAVTKGARIDKIIAETENAIKKIVETSITLERALEL